MVHEVKSQGVALREKYWGAGPLPAQRTALPEAQSSSAIVDLKFEQNGSLVSVEDPVIYEDTEGRSSAEHQYEPEGDKWEFFLKLQLPDALQQYYPGVVSIYGNMNLDNVKSFKTILFDTTACILSDTVKTTFLKPTISKHNMNLFWCVTGALIPKGSAYIKVELEVAPWLDHPASWQLLVNHVDQLQIVSGTPIYTRPTDYPEEEYELV